MKSIRVFHKLFSGLLLLLACATYSYAEGVAGYSEYYVPGSEDDMSLALRSFYTLPASNNTHALITITAWSDNVKVYYDHWENGINFDPANPAATADETFTLATTGTILTLDDTPGGGIPIPRSSASTYYDGGDRIYVAGGAVTVTRISYLEERAIQTVAWEIYPIKPQLTTYILPFGENLSATFPDFLRTFVVIQATADNTSFTVDLNGDGAADPLDQNFDGDTNDAGDTTTVTLQAGESFFLGNVPVNPNPMPRGARATVNSGAVIQGSSTLQVKFVVGDQNANYETRGISAFPRGYWTKEYYVPVGEPANSTVTDIFLYNPHASAITVDYETKNGSGQFTINAGATVSYRTSAGALPQGGGVYLSGSDVFWGVSTVDSTGQVNEWAYSLLPSTLLYTEHYLGWAPGGADGNDSGVFLTVVQDNTRVFVDTNNDGTADQTFTLNRLDTQYITDTNDGDLSGTHFWATGQFSMAFGQNPDTAPAQATSGDLGYVALPSADFVSLVLTVDKSVSPQVVPTASGSVATFTIKVDSQKYTVDGVNVTDYLPPNWDYVISTDTTTITRPDQTTVTGASADPTKTGAGPYTLTWSSAQLGTNGTPGMNTNQEATISFTARTTSVLAAGTLSQNKVKAVGTRTFASQTQTFETADFVYVVSGAIELSKTSGATDPVSPGDTIPYTVTVTNPSSAASNLTGVSLFDPLPEGVSYVPGSGSVSCETAGGSKTVADNFGAAAYSNNDGTTNWVTDWTETDSLGGGAASGLALVTGNALQLRKTVTQNVRDQFNAAAYSNNNGSMNWSGDWTETDIHGKVAGAGAGFVLVTGNALQFRYNTSTYLDNFTSAAYNRQDGTNNWSADWTETGDDGTAGGGVIRADTGNNNLLNFGPGTTGRYITRTAAVSGGSVAIGFALTDLGIDAREGVIASYDLGLGAGFQEIQRITNSTLAGANPLTVNTAGATSITLRFLSFDTGNGTYEAGDNAGVDAVNIAVNDAVGAQIQRTADLTGAASATLNFTYAQANLDAGLDILVVEASTSSAGTFTTLATFNAGTPDVAPPYDLTPYISATTTIRFRVTSGFNGTTETLSIDNVDITAQYSSTTFPAVQRTANLTGASSPSLSFTSTPAGLAAGDTLALEASTSPDGTFTTLATSDGGALSPASPYDLTPYISATTTIRFRITGGYATSAKTFSIDNVLISGLPLSTFAADPPELLSSAKGCLIQPNNSLAATYQVIVDDPLASGIDHITNTASVTSNETILSISASVTNVVVTPSSESAEVGDRVWLDSNGNGVQDVGESGLANVEVTLKDQFGAPVMTTMTDVAGHYQFTGVTPGTGYYVEATSGTLPSGVTQCWPSGHTDNRTDAFDLTAGQVYTDANLGYKPNAGTAIIGNLVWSDANSNGLRDAGEPGLAGVTVQLWQDTNSNGIFELATDTLCTTVLCGTDGTAITGPDGSYLFSGLTAGGTEDYFVRVDETQANLSGYSRTTPSTVPIFVQNINDGDAVLFANYGYNNSASTYFIRDKVWLDADADGIKDSGENGISSVTVDLLDGSLNAIASTTTDSVGNFTFSGLIGGGADYRVKITDTGAILTNYYGTTSAATAGYETINNLTADVDHTSAPDFGYNVKKTIGTTVFSDANGNGVQDAGEIGISGIMVKLYGDANGNGLITSPTDTLIATLVTDADGNYLFTGLSDGNYIVSIESPPAGYTYTGAGGNADSDSGTTGEQQAAAITSGVSVLDRDFPYQPSNPHSVSGTLWQDNNGDGVIDSGEGPLVGVTIDILQGSTNAVISTTSTAADGVYSFNNLASSPSGTYIVKITDTSGVLNGYLTSYEKTEGITSPFDGLEAVDLTSADVNGVNFGYFSVPTLLKLIDFRAYEQGGRAYVRWETASEHNTLGFNLLRLDPATGKYEAVNSGLMPGLFKPHHNGRYTLRDGGASPGGTYTYKLVEVENTGRQSSYGPFTVSVDSSGGDQTVVTGSSGYERRDVADTNQQQALMKTGKAARTTARAAAKTSSGDLIRIPVSADGMYYVKAGDISSLLGLSLADVSSRISQGQLSLTNQGKQAAYTPAANNAGLYFYGAGIDSVYTTENIYWLQKGKGTLMTVSHGAGPGSSSGDKSFNETLHFEQNLNPYELFFSDPGDDYWFWTWHFASSFYTDPPQDLAFEAAGLSESQDTAAIQLHLFGGSDAGVANDHHVVVSLNGVQAAEDWWSGLTPYTVTFTAPISAGTNTLTVEGKADPGVSSSFVLINSFDVTYHRRYEASGDSLSFRSNGHLPVTVGGFTSSDIMVFDVSNPLMPKLNAATTVQPGTTGYTVSLRPAVTATRYISAAGGGIQKASGTAVDAFSLSSTSNAADYIIIAPAGLLSTAQTLADYRTGQGYATMVVDIENIMNEFNYGLADPEAIRTFLSQAYLHWKTAPRYAVLAGDGSMDYKDNLGYGGSLIPSRMVSTPYGLYASDTYLADVNGDHVPELAIGRLPVTTSDELLTVISKIKTYESALGGKNVVLLADTPDDGGEFIEDSEALAVVFTPDYTLNKIYLYNPAMIDDARTALFTAINNGAAFLNYVGHAGPNQLSNSGLLYHYPEDGMDDLPSLTNAGALPVLTSLSCLMGNYSDPIESVLSEALLLKADGGIAASWAPTGLSDDAQASILNREFYTSFVSGGMATLGDAARQALSAYKSSGTSTFMMDIYNILGDPALKMR